MRSPARISKPLGLERLETRDALSVTAAAIGTRLEVVGDAGANHVSIRDDGSGNVAVTVTTGAEVISATGTGIREIVIDTKDGNDLVDYRLTKNLLSVQDLDIDLGAGHDAVRLDLYRGLSGAALDIEIDAGAGRDSADVRFGTINNSTVRMTVALGAEADALSLVMFNGLSGSSSMAVAVAGNSGADRVDFNVMGKIDAAATLNLGAANVVDADDRVVIRYKGELDGKLNVVIDRAAAQYGVQARFALDAASDGTLGATVTDSKGTFKSSLRIIDHTGAVKVTILDRLVRYLTEPKGTKMTK